MPIATPTPGRTLLVDFLNARGEMVTRPAICTRTWGDSPAVQLTAFPDGSNDGVGDTLPMSSVMPRDDEGTPQEHRYSWLPRT